ncbi:sensor histidine kinase, partial [Planktotalea sp.]|uniref:sensor histidine kinase n=1 Tax=Planktotalea sp. TaxID=2029877 RepID=UPI003297C910
ETDVVIHIATHPRLAISVMDEGSGFALDEMATLSGRFVRGKDTGDKVGSGLGLTIAQEVTAAHGGEMTLKNRPEGGACVTLHF